MTDPTPSPELIDEPSLERAFRAVRPVSDDFRRRVDAKIDALEDELERSEAQLSAGPEGLRRAAAVLPPFLLPWAASGAGFVGKKFSVKALPSLLSLPAVSSLMILLTFVGALRSLRKLEDEAREADERQERQVIADWWKRNRGSAQLTLAGLALLVIFRHSEVVMVVVFVSMATAALQIGELARAGLAGRKSVSNTMGRLLGTIGAWWLYATINFGSWQMIGRSTAGLAPLVLLLGAAWCWSIANPSRIGEFLRHPIRMKYPDPITTWCLRVITWSGLLVVAGYVSAYAAVHSLFFLPHEPSSARLVQWVEQFDEPLGGKAWDALGHAAEYLAEVEPEALDLTSASAVVRAALDEDGGVRRATYDDAVRLGLVPRADLVDWIDELDRRGAPLDQLGTTTATGAVEVRARVALDRMDAADRERVRAWVASTWPAPDALDALERMLAATELLERIGDEEAALARRQEVHDALRERWRYPLGISHGLARIMSFRRNGPSFGDDQTNANAALLMRRFDVPEGIDFEQFRGAVRAESAVENLFGWDASAAHRELALLVLQEIEPRPTGVLRGILRHRVFLASILLASFCVLASLRGPRVSEGVQR